MGFLFSVLRRTETELPQVNKDAANISSLCLKESKGRNVEGNGYLHSAAGLNPASMKNEALCLPVVKQEAGVLRGLAKRQGRFSE